MYERIKNYLIAEPRSRERTLHQRGMVNLLLEDYPDLFPVPKDKLVDFCHDFESYCRIWRKVLSENPELRGQDYGETDGAKTILEQKKMLELGYEPNYNAKKILL
jgi:hypothetical protein